jgi:hypothetical protein
VGAEKGILMATETETIEVTCCHDCPFLDDNHDTCERASGPVGGREFDGDEQDYEGDPPDWCPLRDKHVLVVLDGVG